LGHFSICHENHSFIRFFSGIVDPYTHYIWGQYNAVYPLERRRRKCVLHPYIESFSVIPDSYILLYIIICWGYACCNIYIPRYTIYIYIILSPIDVTRPSPISDENKNWTPWSLEKNKTFFSKSILKIKAHTWPRIPLRPSAITPPVHSPISIVARCFNLYIMIIFYTIFKSSNDIKIL